MARSRQTTRMTIPARTPTQAPARSPALDPNLIGAVYSGGPPHERAAAVPGQCMLRVMPHTQTPNDEAETLSDREFMERLGIQVQALTGSVAELYGFIRDRAEVEAKQLDHLDTMTHQVLQFIEEHRPALNRALAFMEPGKGIRDYLKNRPKAGDK